MEENDIAFTITIPINEESANDVINAFLGANLYNSTYIPTFTDIAGNIVNNPITPQMYVEDCLGYYVMDITRNYLIGEASGIARNIAAESAQEILNNLRNYINSNP